MSLTQLSVLFGGAATTKDIVSALQQAHEIGTEAGKRLQRMVKSGEVDMDCRTPIAIFYMRR